MSRARAIGYVFAVFIAVCVTAGCGAVESRQHSVSGHVHGLWDGSGGVALRLEASGSSSLLTVASDGAFTFLDPLGNGVSYTVTVANNPSKHTCVVDSGGNGTIANADVTEVSVACVGPATSIALSGLWGWTFDPAQDTQTFAGSVAAQSVALTVSGDALTGAEVNGVAATLGARTAPIQLPLGMTSVAVALTASGGLSKTYHLVFDRGGSALDQVVYGKASNPGTGDGLGYSVALSGNTLAVGAYFESSAAVGVDGDQDNDDASHAGAVYVFVRSGATWSQQAYLKASNTGSGDNFGRAIALSGDTLVVGAPQEASAATGVGGNQADNTAAGAGAVYVFVRSGTTWSQQAYLKASNTNSFDAFGGAVALTGDTLAVGATGESSAATGVGGSQTNNDASSSGAVYVFTRTGSTWTQQAYVKASNTGAGDDFGAAVALSGDTLAVGATGEASAATGVGGNQADNSATSAGAVYVFTRTASTWTQQSYVKASNTGAGDLFGNAVALAGDTLVVGAFGEASAATGVNGDQADNTALAAGAVYVFVRSSGTWTQQAYLKASNSGHDYEFGSAVALAGDLLVVGSMAENSGATGVGGNQRDGSAPGAGAAYVFTRSATTWAQAAYVKSSNTGSDDGFGSAVAASADTLVVGAFGESSSTPGLNPMNGQADNGASGAGAIYVFR